MSNIKFIQHIEKKYKLKNLQDDFKYYNEHGTLFRQSELNFFQLRKVFDKTTVDEFVNFMTKQSPWYSKAPGGFLNNYPKRLVNAYGTGSGINSLGEFVGIGLKQTAWTAKINQNNVSLHTDTADMPKELISLIPGLRKLFSLSFPDVMITNNTFTIGVCNYYTDPDMYIAAHTDDDSHYPNECSKGPVFASITLYPDGVPETDLDYARFQIKNNGKWESVKLPHESICIMPSGIEHRVMPHLKSRYKSFKPRINITFRSTYPWNINPLMNAKAVANHSRYYRVPVAVTYSPLTDIKEILLVYNNFAVIHGYNKLDINCVSKEDRNKSVIIKKYLSYGYPKPKRFSSNIVYELLNIVLTILNKD
jgi:hypothetical protein